MNQVIINIFIIESQLLGSKVELKVLFVKLEKKTHGLLSVEDGSKNSLQAFFKNLKMSLISYLSLGKTRF